jgi:hypothetical protein
MKMIITLALILALNSSIGGPVLSMNRAFNAVTELIPFLVHEDQFKDKKNDTVIKTHLKELGTAFKLAGHDDLIKHDLFAPSYELLTEDIYEMSKSFEEGKKDYSYWMMRETMTMCLDCHARLPKGVTSSFQDGELSVNTKKIQTPFELGLTYMIVRRFVDAKQNFTREIQDNIIRKNFSKILQPLKHILMIETKIKRDPVTMISIIDDYTRKNNFPSFITSELQGWKKRLLLWRDEKLLSGISTESELKDFIKRRLLPLKRKGVDKNEFKVDLLFASGLISTYFFENQNSPSAPEIGLWLGWIEKRLKRDDFMSSGDLFLKQCIRKYSKHPVAKECLEEYRESVEFDFTGSGGTSIPREIEKELDDLERLVSPKK